MTNCLPLPSNVQKVSAFLSSCNSRPIFIGTVQAQGGMLLCFCFCLGLPSPRKTPWKTPTLSLLPFSGLVFLLAYFTLLLLHILLTFSFSCWLSLSHCLARYLPFIAICVSMHFCVCFTFVFVSPTACCHAPLSKPTAHQEPNPLLARSTSLYATVALFSSLLKFS